MMKISGLQKLTLLDYPEKVACTIFTSGCNFRCPFCHNASLVIRPSAENYSEEEILSFLKKRIGILEGICVTGGEPLCQNDITEFLSKVKNLGYSVKLDTNGSFPKKLKELVKSGLVDYVAMDIKNSLSDYAKTVGIENFDTAPIKESIDFLLEGNTPYEFRTTVVKELHTTENMSDIAKLIKGADKYFLQNFLDSGDLIGENLSAHSKETLEEMKNILIPYVEKIEIRGV